MVFAEYFFCEQIGARMAKVVCVRQRERARVSGASRARSLERCRDCDQGREIEAELEARHETVQPGH